MATYRDNLITTRDQIAARLAEVTDSPKPNYSIDGQSVSWAEYFSTLTGQLEAINKLIQQAGSPFMTISRWKV